MQLASLYYYYVIIFYYVPKYLWNIKNTVECRTLLYEHSESYHKYHQFQIMYIAYIIEKALIFQTHLTTDKKLLKIVLKF